MTYVVYKYIYFNPRNLMIRLYFRDSIIVKAVWSDNFSLNSDKTLESPEYKLLSGNKTSSIITS